MKKVINIDGMSCGHCQAKVEQALNQVPHVTAKVNLKKKQAVVELDGNVSDEALRQAVEDAGFVAVSIEEKKGLFG